MNASLGTVGTVLHRKGPQVWTIAPGAMVFEAIQMMADKNIGALLVTDGSGKLLGIVSERDYARKVILKGHSSKDTAVRDIMTCNLITVTPKETVSDCMRLMTEKRIRHLPIMSGDKLAGLLSIGDLVKWIMAAQEMTIDQLEKYITGGYPG
jgi:CBS domain-containing protein